MPGDLARISIKSPERSFLSDQRSGRSVPVETALSGWFSSVGQAVADAWIQKSRDDQIIRGQRNKDSGIVYLSSIHGTAKRRC